MNEKLERARCGASFTWSVYYSRAMSKLIGFTAFLVIAALAVAIASLVLNILILNQVNSVPDTPTDPTAAAPEDVGCPSFDQVSKDAGWKEAADRLLATVDTSVDPCEDFYQFTCGKYLQDTDLQGQSRKGTYDEAQYNINVDLANYFDGHELTDLKSSTEKIQKNFLDLCMADTALDNSDPDVVKSKLTTIKAEIDKYLGFPLFSIAKVPTDNKGLFTTLATMEKQFTSNPLLMTFVTADFKNNLTNALYINQPALAYPRDYYVLPQFIADLQDYAKDIRDALSAYSKTLGLTFDTTNGICAAGDEDFDCATKMGQWAVNLERSIAMASWPETELRNYKQQYTPFDNLDTLDARFQSLNLGDYVRELRVPGATKEINVVVSEPTYFASLDALFQSNSLKFEDFVNYLSIQFLMESIGEFGPEIPDAATGRFTKKTRRTDGEKVRLPYINRRGHGARRITRKPLNTKGLGANDNDRDRANCMDGLLNYMPYGPGYTYVRNRDDRDAVRADVSTQADNIIAQFGAMMESLQWIDPESLDRAKLKSKYLVKNLLWPDWYGDDWTKTDKVDDYNKNYNALSKPDVTTYWEALKTVKLALMQTEQFEFLEKDDYVGQDLRTNFLSSPATVNAWYQPERNSITFPFGILNPPYYNLNYPQAYNYAGQGGTAGHELTHGYDDEGTQFDEFGMLADCEFTHCSILDDDSRSGFVDMAQCVVQQYNTQCCPLKTGNVRCANGATTQGENIADIGGQQAAYRAYNQYMASQHDAELRLPGLEQFSPKQIFWMTYGVSWCMKITDARLQKQLMTDPHAPSSCRVNQVMQDIPQFGQDFKCKRGSPMYPEADDRCMVWVGF